MAGSVRAAGSAGSSKRRWAIFGVLSATAALTILDVSKVGVALPAIQESTGGSGSTVQFMLVGYTLAYAVLLLPAGRIGDVLPRKHVFLVGGAAFLVASIVCAVAPSIGWLIAGRLIQGAGAGILMPQVLGLIQRIFPAEERAKPLALMAAVISATSLFGPVFAGLVMELVGGAESWRALFWINVAVGVVVLPIAAIVIREPDGERHHGFDLVGVLLLAPAVVLTVAPLSTISQSTPPAAWMAVSTAVGLLLAWLFVVHERRRHRRGREALVDPLLFGFRHLTLGVVISGFMYAAGTAGTLIVTIGLQQAGGLSALETALWMLPAALSTVVASWVMSRIPQRATYRLIAIGTAVGAAALLAIAVTFGAAPVAALPVIVCVLLVASSCGSAFAGPANQARTLVEVPGYRASVAGSLIQFSQRVGSAIGMSLALILYYGFEFDLTPAGRDTLGPTLAIALTAGFLVIASVLALQDRPRLGSARRSARVPGIDPVDPAAPAA